MDDIDRESGALNANIPQIFVYECNYDEIIQGNQPTKSDLEFSLVISMLMLLEICRIAPGRAPDLRPNNNTMIKDHRCRRIDYFSTKYEDVETGLLYYGYRYCAPSEAWHLLRGASPRRKSLKGGSREGQELATRFVASLAGVKERRKRMNDTTEA